MPASPTTKALFVFDSGQEILVEFDPDQPRDPKTGRWWKRGGLPGLPLPPSPSSKSRLFLDPYHTTPERRASPRFEALAPPASREEAREKVGEAEVLLAPQIEGMLRGMAPGDERRFPEGTLATMNESGDGYHFRVDGPDGVFWRVPLKDAGVLIDFEEETARANRFGESIPGNPMVPLPGVDVAPKDPIGDQIGGVLHGGYATLPRGTLVHRAPGVGGDTFELTSPTGVRRDFPATDKEAIIACARDFERMAEGKLGGDVEQLQFAPTTTAVDPDGPLQPLPPGFKEARIALHAESTRVLGFEHGGNEVALVQTEGGFGTPVYTDEDGLQTQMRVEGTDVVLDKFPFEEPSASEAARRPVTPAVDPASAKALADFFTLADKVERDLRPYGVVPKGEVTDRRFDAPIIWPEHFDMAVELGEGTEHRAVYGASPGDEGHPEPYFYVNPWELKPHDETWNANGFNGAELTYAEVLASSDQEKTIRDFFLKYLRLTGGAKSPSASPAMQADALAEFRLAFDPNQPRDRKGRWRKTGAPSTPSVDMPDEVRKAAERYSYDWGKLTNERTREETMKAIGEVALAFPQFTKPVGPPVPQNPEQEAMGMAADSVQFLGVVPTSKTPEFEQLQAEWNEVILQTVIDPDTGDLTLEVNDLAPGATNDSHLSQAVDKNVISAATRDPYGRALHEMGHAIAWDSQITNDEIVEGLLKAGLIEEGEGPAGFSMPRMVPDIITGEPQEVGRRSFRPTSTFEDVSLYAGRAPSEGFAEVFAMLNRSDRDEWDGREITPERRQAAEQALAKFRDAMNEAKGMKVI